MFQVSPRTCHVDCFRCLPKSATWIVSGVSPKPVTWIVSGVSPNLPHIDGLSLEIKPDSPDVSSSVIVATSSDSDSVVPDQADLTDTLTSTDKATDIVHTNTADTDGLSNLVFSSLFRACLF